jgi:hypothetical protein
MKKKFEGDQDSGDFRDRLRRMVTVGDSAMTRDPMNFEAAADHSGRRR